MLGLKFLTRGSWELNILFIIFTFTCQYDQLVGVCSARLKKGGSYRCGHS